MKETHVICNTNIMMGKPVIEGTRITVELILEKMAAGESAERIYDDYPHLPKDAIQVALAFAVSSLRADFAYPFVGLK